ncbi:MAG: CapA family protein, partial [Ruminococcus sp.]|nr:CapA family protein [Ruminococcus sp.]
SCHYGTEITNELNTQQKTITPKLVEWGADIIIGTQAHALSASADDDIGIYLRKTPMLP